ncbi:hypothetical protein NAF17_00565 [Mucilaginibacter sp. RB4R14]|uniref:cellulase N-terminal Ig-like domain-containing protein n=1 Tax=Mucilaginibacter aurantiaciroseus TaxID=2949308 RepID=UPI0020917AD9|nr:cellulase N-terminal Ig-like domain-containing protein [Mucilaginibacter aurantiaciroseus]MCO5934015.1 hypothetical protein [Mucilaginibacter aurantiaciroseus]
MIAWQNSLFLGRDTKSIAAFLLLTSISQKIKNFFRAILCISFLIGSYAAFAKPVIYVNQIAFDSNAPKTAVIELDSKAAGKLSFNLIDANGK